jgi:nifR3 family TIM-barrel protein
MIASRALSGRVAAARRNAVFAESETFRSLQLYCLDAHYSALATQMVVKENLADHIDLNFGCPVRKVTANGGGSAIPWKRGLYREIIQAVVKNAGDLPVTVKIRIGIDDEHITYLDAGLIAVEEGCAAVTLHARTTRQYYAGCADWSYIRKLREELPDSVSVFGNGDVWGVEDAQRLLGETNADAVAIGRGAVGRPWLFAELAQYFTSGEVTPYRPSLGQVVDIMIHHLELLLAHYEKVVRGDTSPSKLACRNFRSHIGAYLKGFPVGSETKVQLLSVNNYHDLISLLQKLPRDIEYPQTVENKPRGRTRSASKVFLPPNWLASRDVC